MSHIASVLNSSVGKKFIQALTGLALFAFLIAHLIGNLTLLLGQRAFNDYAYFLEELGHGAVVPIADIFLLVFFLTHAWTGIQIALGKRSSRPRGYEAVGHARGRSRKSLASVSMIVTGIALLIFVPLHLWNFKYGGPQEIWIGDPARYPGSYQVRDIYSLVVQKFHNPYWLAFYEVVMLLLGFHLWHGVWSAFQSLGATHPRWMPYLNLFGWAFAVLLSAGFLFIPLYVMFGIPKP